MYAPETILVSNQEYVVKPSSLCVISSNVGALWCSQIMDLLKSFKSSHILMVPLALLGYVSEHINGVGYSCGVIILCIVISLHCVSISSMASIGTQCLP